MKILRVTLAVFIILLFLTALSCQNKSGKAGGPSADNDSKAKGTEKTEAPSGDVKVNIPGEGTVQVSGDEGKTTITGKDGETQVILSGGLPEDWPKDVPLKPGFTVESAVANSSADTGKGFTVNAKGVSTLAEVAKFYGGLEGWQKDPEVPEVTQTGKMSLFGMMKGEARLMVSINMSDEKDSKEISLLLTYFSKKPK